MRAKSRRGQQWLKPRLTVSMVLDWADEYHQRQGQWPHHFSGRIGARSEDTWARVNDALAQGNRGLPGGSSLAHELYRHRGVRSPRNVPPLRESQILDWARSHFKQLGKWPSLTHGSIEAAPGETWAAIDLALSRGTRGLPGGSSLAQLLAARGVKFNPQRRRRLTKELILAWADAFFRVQGHWPYFDSGPIVESPGDTWLSIQKALKRRSRGVRMKTTLVAFLNAHRKIFLGKSRRPRRIAPSQVLRLDQIMAWGRAFRKRTGSWPNRDSGSIPDSGGSKWSAIDSALKAGNRGLPGGLSLAKLFKSRNVLR